MEIYHIHLYFAQTTSVPESQKSSRSSLPRKTVTMCGPSMPMRNQMLTCEHHALYPKQEI